MKNTAVLQKILVGLGVLVFGLGLGGYIIAGTYSRYMKDDYCYAATLGRRTFLEGQSYSYLNAVDFSGNRFSLTLGMGLSELAGRGVVSVLPASMLALWLPSLYILIRQLNPFWKRGFSKLESLLAAETIALFTITMAPNWIQVIYWRPGMFPYFAPIVFGCWLAVLILGYKPGARTILYLAGIFLLALLVGGFSEVACAVESTALALAVGGGLLSGDRQRWLPTTITALGGALAALALLAFSPVTTMRLNSLYGGHANLLTAILDSAGNVINFYLGIAYRSTLLYASVFVFFCILSLVERMRNGASGLALKSIPGQIVTWLAVVFLLTWAAMLPSFYAESGAPGQRVLVIPVFISIVLAARLGILTGELGVFLPEQPRKKGWDVTALLFMVILIGGLWLGASQKSPGIPDYPILRTFATAGWLYIISLLALSLFVSMGIGWRFGSRVAIFAALMLYLCQPVLISGHIYAQLPALQERAQAWDQRDAQILALRAQNITDITVVALDSLAGIGELSFKPGHWINACAAKYYKIKSIKAIQVAHTPPQP
jgi:hypothetical protein